MFSLFKKEKENEKDGSHLSLISVAALLIHSAKIDENFTEKEKLIIKKALIEMGADHKNIDEINPYLMNSLLPNLSVFILFKSRDKFSHYLTETDSQPLYHTFQSFLSESIPLFVRVMTMLQPQRPLLCNQNATGGVLR